MPAPVYDDGGQASSASGPANNSHFLSNAAAGNYAAFEVTGGLYAVETVSTGAGTLSLQRLLPNSSTWISVVTVATTTSYGTVQLARGQYRWSVSGFTGNWAAVNRIPQA